MFSRKTLKVKVKGFGWFPHPCPLQLQPASHWHRSKLGLHPLLNITNNQMPELTFFRCEKRTYDFSHIRMFRRDGQDKGKNTS